MRAEWDGVSTEQTATVRVKQGVAKRLSEVVGDILDQSEGAIHNVEKSYQDIIGSIDKRIAVEEDRLVALQARLQAKYARLEKLMVQLQGEQQWSAGLAGSMAGPPQ